MIDINFYVVTNNEPLQVEELSQPKRQWARFRSLVRPLTLSQGLLQGGEFVTARAREMVSGRF